MLNNQFVNVLLGKFSGLMLINWPIVFYFFLAMDFLFWCIYNLMH
jgi:hypothetical protein